MHSTQTWGNVFAAEFKRIVLRIRALVALTLFAIAGIGVTVGSMWIMEFAKQEAAKGTVTGLPGDVKFVGLGLAISLVSFATGLMCVSSTARDYRDGTAAATLVAVPKRTRLLSARMVVWVIVAAIVSVVTLVPLALMYGSTYAQPGSVWLEAVCGIVGTCVLVLVAFACATLTRRGSLAMLVFLGIDLLLPMVISFAAGFVPTAVGNVLSTVHAALPGQAIDAIMNVSALQQGNAGPWIFGLAALAAWTVAAIAMSHVAFARYAGASD